jgi:MYXO-CTERM domain-containing protein
VVSFTVTAEDLGPGGLGCGCGGGGAAGALSAALGALLVAARRRRPSLR